MKAIITKYIPASSIKGSRIQAKDCDKNIVYIPYPHELSGEEVHKAAALKLCEKMGWPKDIIGGAIKDGYAFVFKNK